jgi:hypothetical protein
MIRRQTHCVLYAEAALEPRDENRAVANHGKLHASAKVMRHRCAPFRVVDSIRHGDLK